jgi:hypothetical protein
VDRGIRCLEYTRPPTLSCNEYGVDAENQFNGDIP